MENILAMADYRYERKYLTEDYSAKQLESFLKVSQGLFRPIFYPRRVWSMYFDTFNLDYYQQNELGSRQRKKVRVRWYEHDNQVSPVQLEVKIRDGEVSRKVVYKLKEKVTSLSIATLKNKLSEWLKMVAEESNTLKPVVVNSYLRQYFKSGRYQSRVTIDSDLQFQSIRDWQENRLIKRLGATILEVKYSLEQDEGFDQLVRDLPLRITKSSKYMMGMQLCS